MVRRVDDADRAGLRTHHDRLGLRGVAKESDAVEQIALRNTGRGKHDVPLREVLEPIDEGFLLDAHTLGSSALFVASKPQPPLKVATDALERRSRDHSFRGA